MNKPKNNIFKTVFRIVLLALCGGVLGLNLYLANANKLVGNQLPMPFGYGAAVVLSGSMEPAIYTGDLIIVSEKQPYEVDDIVVFQSGNSLVVHRVMAMDETTVTTKGDANNAYDAPVDKAVVKGTVIAVVPKVGTLVQFIKTPIGTLIVVAAVFVLTELPYRRKKQKDDEERQKIIDEIKRLKDEK